MPTLWTPSELDTELWLDASDSATITLSGNDVMAWGDKSGKGRNTTQAGFWSKPQFSADGLNGRACLIFQSTINALDLASTLALSDVSFFVVFEPTVLNYSSRTCIFQDGTNHGFRLSQAGDNLEFYLYPSGGVVGHDSGSYLSPSPHLINAGYDQTNGYLFVNGTSQWSASSSGALRAGTGSARIGAELSDISTNRLVGKLSEIIVTRGTISSADRVRLEGYLAHKWGVEASLPSSHAFRYDAPVQQELTVALPTLTGSIQARTEYLVASLPTLTGSFTGQSGELFKANLPALTGSLTGELQFAGPLHGSLARLTGSVQTNVSNSVYFSLPAIRGGFVGIQVVPVNGDETLVVSDALTIDYVSMLAAGATIQPLLTIQQLADFTLTSALMTTDQCISRFSVLSGETLSVADDLNAAVRAVLELAVLLEAQDTQTTSLSIATNLLETLVTQDVAHAVMDMSLEDTTTLADQLSGAIRAQLALPETVRLRDEIETSLIVSIPLLTTASLLDRLGSLVALTLGETAILADSAALGAAIQAGGAEALQVSAISELLTVLGVSLDEQATLQAVQHLTQVRDVLMDETATLTDAQRIGLQMVLAASEQLEVSDTSELLVAMLARLHETVNLDDLATVSISTWLNLTDGAAFIARLPLEDGDYQAWVMNAETTGTTQYVNYPMNSLFTFHGVPYGVSETGLYRLEGETDDGEPINSVVATGDMNFGTSREKNIPRCYLYLTQTGQVVLKTISSRQGSRHETYYELAERTTDSTDDDTYRRVPLARGVRGVWWRFELHALNGATINLDGAEIRPVVLSRRG